MAIRCIGTRKNAFTSFLSSFTLHLDFCCWHGGGLDRFYSPSEYRVRFMGLSHW